MSQNPKETLDKAVKSACDLVDELLELSKGAPLIIGMLIMLEIKKAVELKDKLTMLKSALEEDTEDAPR